MQWLWTLHGKNGQRLDWNQSVSSKGGRRMLPILGTSSTASRDRSQSTRCHPECSFNWGSLLYLEESFRRLRQETHRWKPRLSQGMSYVEHYLELNFARRCEKHFFSIEESTFGHTSYGVSCTALDRFNPGDMTWTTFNANKSIQYSKSIKWVPLGTREENGQPSGSVIPWREWWKHDR